MKIYNPTHFVKVLYFVKQENESGRRLKFLRALPVKRHHSR